MDNQDNHGSKLPPGNKSHPNSQSKWANQDAGTSLPEFNNPINNVSDKESETTNSAHKENDTIKTEISEKKEAQKTNATVSTPPKIQANKTAGIQTTKGSSQTAKVPVPPTKTPPKKPDQNKKSLDKIDFLSESRSVTSEKSPGIIKFTIYFIIVMLLSSSFWAHQSEIDITVNANGKVVPTSHLQVVQNLEGGLVSKIFIKEGHFVKKDQTLVELDDTRFKAEYNEKRTRLLVLQAEIYRLRAEANGDEVYFPKRLALEAPEIIEHARVVFNKNRKSFQRNLSILEESYQLSEEELKIVEPLARQGIMSNLELLRLRRELNTHRGRITELTESHRKVAREEMHKMRSDLKVVKEQIKTSYDRMIRTDVKSPVDGVVNKLYITSIGEVITPDEKILEIVPSDDTLSIKLNIEPKDIGFIKTDQQASIKISAYDYAIYGDVKGKVTQISADATKDESGQAFYTVTLEANKNHIGKIEENLAILPGMTVTASITTSKRSILSYFLKPLLKLKEEAFVSR